MHILLYNLFLTMSLQFLHAFNWLWLKWKPPRTEKTSRRQFIISAFATGQSVSGLSDGEKQRTEGGRESKASRRLMFLVMNVGGTTLCCVERRGRVQHCPELCLPILIFSLRCSASLYVWQSFLNDNVMVCECDEPYKSCNLQLLQVRSQEQV